MLSGPGLLSVGRYAEEWRTSSLVMSASHLAAVGGSRGEDAAAFAERLERFRFGLLVDGFVRVEGRVVLREGGCDLGVVGFLVGFAGWRVLGIGGVGPVTVHELFDPLCRVLGCPLAVEGGRVNVVFSAVLVGFLFEHVVEGASGA